MSLQLGREEFKTSNSLNISNIVTFWRSNVSTRLIFKQVSSDKERHINNGQLKLNIKAKISVRKRTILFANFYLSLVFT